ncbi:MAG TPA: biopolymer transporter ExbD [Stenomitos sp.]
MRFKNQQRDSSMPEVNLVPMMDVLMTVLTFFIITSMTLTGQRTAFLNLPGVGTGVSEQTAPEPEPFEVGLNQQGEILLEGKTISDAQLAETMQSYLAQNPQGSVVLKADRKLPYDKVEKLLKQMSKIGGSNVSLAIEQK